jgi:hypothetical protein
MSELEKITAAGGPASPLTFTRPESATAIHDKLEQIITGGPVNDDAATRALNEYHDIIFRDYRDINIPHPLQVRLPLTFLENSSRIGGSGG